ncbi:MAG: hypothetical protein A3K19_13750 [Lentisphaerae bacterium RIFOXYB12_FULL_65_16]|nr:MAG: hypothetical protein A3K18_00055 [Lentisphaerae bacterium RIFOXYA12_64_32]OGV84214.1 MAG: hypothetical protein A3K19_13750 [Lentisphaerae bacterium RIFOXYB12_FULL_65_16]
MNPNTPPHAPAGTEVHSKVPIDVIVELVKFLCLTFANIKMYSLDHPVVRKTAGETWEHLRQALERYKEVSLHMAEGKLLMEGVPAEEHNPSVRKLSHHFEVLKVGNLLFRQGLSLEELMEFLRAFSRDPAEVEAAGGMEAILREKGVQNVRLNASLYRLIREDEKVVGADAVVVDQAVLGNGVPRGRRTGGGMGKDENIVEYFSEEMLRHTSDRGQLLNRMKNSPVELAQHLVEVMAHLDEHKESVTRDQLMETMMENIRVAGEAIATKDLISNPEEQKTMVKSMASLESELRRQSHKLASKGANDFLDRLVNVVSSYADTSRAQAVLNEFIEHEGSLKSAEQLLTQISGDAASSRRLLERMKAIMDERKIKADDLLALLEQNTVGKRAAPRQVSKTFRPLADRLRDKLKSDFKGVENPDELINYLDTVFDREIKRVSREETEATRQELERVRAELNEAQGRLQAVTTELDGLRGAIAEMDHMLTQTGVGVAVLDPGHRITTLVHGDLIPEFHVGDKLSDELYQALEAVTDETIAEYGHGQIVQVDRDTDGDVHAFVFTAAQV